MKNTALYYIAAGVCLAACSAPNQSSIEVSNSLDAVRNGEMVCAKVDTSKPHILKDAQGNEVAYQVKGDGILFLADVPAQGTATYSWTEGTPAEVKPLTTAFFLGDRRKDDFCWENDKAAYRMYGPALLKENPSSGVDLWLKHSSDLTADAMYTQEEKEGKPYHVDFGLGIDSYKVGHAAGCGGVAIVSDGKIWPGGPYARYEILQQGPLQTIFKLAYDSVQVGENVLSEEITITVNAGANMNKAEVVLKGADIADLQLGGAIFLHDSIQNLNIAAERGYITYCETANSDKGIYGIHQQQGIDPATVDFGRNYCAVFVPGAEDFAQYDNTEVAVRKYKVGDTLTYYFGGAWSKRDYATDQEWDAAIGLDAKRLSSPLTVTVK
ncbi:MAG: DUF4861 domain-containing protein [Bacteroidales bacterium]|nr:DUF4861 domain-containing protein [Bacteroidales bacterium]